MLHETNYMSCGNVAQCKNILNNIVVVFPELAKENTIHTFVYGLKPCLKFDLSKYSNLL